MIVTSHSTRNFLGKRPLKTEKDTRIIKILSRTLSTKLIATAATTVIIFIYNAQKKRKEKNFTTMCT